MAGFYRPLFLLVAILAVPAFYLAWQRTGRSKKIVAGLHGIIILMIAAAAAGPFIDTQQQISETPQVVVLKDESTSASLLDEADLEFQDVEVTERVIASGNSSDLKNGITRNLEEDTAYLAISDFQTTGEELDGLSRRFNSRNSSLNVLKTSADEDAAVALEGPSRTVPGAENTFTVSVSSTDEVPEPSVTLDGSSVSLQRRSNDTWSFTRTFNSRDSHTITASLDVEDRFSSNDRYYHSVQVVEKPEILFVGSRGVLGDRLSKFYDITYSSSLPSDLSPYYAVIASEEVSGEQITPYVTEGNGLVYTADVEEDAPGVLPVKKADAGSLTDATRTVIAVDNSAELGGEGEEARKTSLRVSGAVVDGLKTNNRVGLVYYNGSTSGEAGVLSQPVPLARNRDRLKRKIAGLNPGGLAFHESGLKAARQMTNDSGNIILVTDGALAAGSEGQDFQTTYGYETQQESYSIAESLESNLIIVGVGSLTDKENIRGGEEFLKELEERSGGQYYPAERLLNGGTTVNLLGGGGETSYSAVTVVRDDHFITEGMELETSVENSDPVETKRGSTELARIADGNPFLTVWRYGLGRSAAFTGDTEQLEQTVALDPLMVSRTVSWAVGDPKRKQDRWLRVESGRKPDTVEARANYRIPGFARQGDELYTREFDPGSQGFHEVNGTVYAYNYPRELQNVGYSDSMENLVQSTGGRVYDPGQRQEIADDIKSFSENSTIKRQPLSPYLLAAALLVFLAEVGYRKVKGKK